MQRHLLVVLISAGFLSFQSFANDPECMTLSTGTEYCEPFKAKGAKELMIFSEANYDFVASQVQKWGLKPVSVSNGNNQKAFVILDFVSYQKTSVGPYNEMIIITVTQPMDSDISFKNLYHLMLTRPKLRKDGVPNFSFFAFHLSLGGENTASVEDAIAVGLEAYGYPKVWGEMDYDLTGFNSRSVKVRHHDRSWEIRAKVNSVLPPVGFIPFPQKAFIAATGTNELCYSRMPRKFLMSAPQKFTKNDSLEFEGNGEIPELMAGLKLTPKLWMVSPSMSLNLTGLSGCLYAKSK